MQEKKNIFIHPSSIVEEGASIGCNTKIWHWVHICSGAKIGNECSFGQNVFVGNKAKIGNNVKIQNNVSIYDRVFIEDDVFCGPSVVFTNVYNPRSEFSRKDEYLETHIERGVTLGANSTIVCGVRIQKYAFIGAGALINKNIKSFSLMVGVPAKQIGWMSRFGERIPLPLKGEGGWFCPHTNDNYILKNGNISFCSSKLP